MKDSLNTLKELASSVRNATKEGENSAERIGRLFEGILEYIKTPESIENYFELKQDSNGLDYIYTKYNIASAGALSMYASDKINVPSIYDGLPIDNDTIYWHEVDGSKVLKAKGGGGEAGSVQWDNISGKPSWIEDTKPSYSWSDITGEKPFYTKEEIASKYVTIDTEQEITALKHFTAGLSVGESKKKIYEENGVVYIDADVAVTGAMTFYASAGRSVSTIMDAVAVDGITIKKENNVLKAIAGAGSSFDENAMWSALSGSSDNQINKSHLTMALEGYATRNWVIENYATKSELSAVSNKLNDFLEGSDTDNIINKWKELEAFLSGMAETDNLAEILKTKADRSYVDSTFVTLATKQTITGEKTFSSLLNTAAIKASGAITAPSLAVSDWVTIAGIKLRKLEDGALMLEGNLALTGALTMYATGAQGFDTIYDGLPIDNDTIYWSEVEGSKVLKAKEGSGSSFDKSAMWTALAGSTTEQINKSHLTTALTGYATESWVSGKNYAVKATTLAGYGITDGINAVSVTGTGNAVTAASISGHTLTLTKGATFNNYTHPTATATTITAANGKVLSAITVNNQGHVTSVSGKTLAAADIPTLEISKISGLQDSLDAKLESSAYTAADVLAKLKTVDGSNSGLDADLLDGTHKTALFTALASSSATNISITVGGTTKSIADLFANSAAKLETARTIWGQSFDGTKPVTGALTSVTDITGTGTFTGANLKATDSVYVNGIRLHKTSDGVITLEGNLAVTGGVTMYAIDPVSASTIMDGVVVDGTTIKKENGKLVAVGGGEAGSVAWGNISGKPSVFATNIANITDLHSSWDSVLAAQKPAWLTAVSIATISDLNSGWDALLKAAPSAYVTRWPTISEVTNKQNLVIKLNGGTTEGTNQFTYNATAAKTINITASSVGAAASSHNHSWSNITSGKPTTLAGYGITDAPTKTGSGASGTWGINISGNASNADKLDGTHKRTGDTYWGVIPYVETDGTFEIGKYLDFHVTSSDTKDYSTRVQAQGAHNNLVSLPTSNGQIALITDNVYSATKLQNKRYFWGQGFDGTTDVTGLITAYNGINLPYGQQIQTEYGTLLASGYNSESGYNDFFQLTAVGANKIARSLVGGNTGKLVWEGHLFELTTYGGGWYMIDSEWMRTYNHKGVVCNELWVDSRVRFGGNAEFGGNYSPNGVVFYDRTRTQRGIFAWYNDHFYIAKFENNKESTGYVAVYEDYVGVGGNLLVSGGGTFYSSDIRYKSIMQQVKLSLLEIAEAPSFVYRWNRPNMNQNRLNLGGSAQYTQSVLPWAVEDNDNFLSMDYATVAYTFAVHTARHLLTYETRTDKKIKKLEREIVILKKQLKKLGYEEVRTLDDSGI